ncbi:MAG TPA: c-type cytochrome [Terracidiphilus sp.]|jgi:mono/diheme cytochrome c family protein|nr:c-type cytochrome [Terracidiphilus sp.]
MKRSIWILAGLLSVSVMCLAKADGKWLGKVPQSDHERTNPYAGELNAAAGRNLFVNNCAKCHGENAEGKGTRPSLRSQRMRLASDGDIAWLIKNGNLYKGMPSWGGLPEPERWQIVAYLRSLNAGSSEGQR